MAILCLLLALIAAPVDAQGMNQPARITGRVVAADSGAPVRGATVQLMGSLTPSPTVVTDADGRFEFLERRVGLYTLVAAKAGFVTNTFGRLPDGQTPDSPNQFELVAGQQITRILRLHMAGVISGRVNDEAGEPVGDAVVMAWRREFPQPGVQVRRQVKDVRTNDLGEFRIHGLMPGTYAVSAGHSSSAAPLRPMDEEIAHVYRSAEMGMLAYSGPGAAVSEAITIDVAPGGESTGASLVLPRARYAKVSGTVIDSTGRLASNTAISLRPTTAVPPSMRDSGQIFTPGGKFSFSSVPVGQYMLRVTAEITSTQMVQDASGAQRERTTMRSESAAIPIDLRGDTTDLTVHLTPRVVAAAFGRIFVDNAPAAEPIKLQHFTVAPGQQPVQSSSPLSGAPFSGKSPDTFVITAENGMSLLRYTGSPLLSLKAVTLNGADVTDGFEVSASIQNLEVHLTSVVTMLRGSIKGADDRPAADCDVVRFAAEPAAWNGPVSRRVLLTRSNKDGEFQATSLPPGEYLAVALPDLDRAMWADPQRLLQLRAYATPFALSEGTTSELKLETRRRR